MIDKRAGNVKGSSVDLIAPSDLAVIDPATERAFDTISLGTEADIDRAVSAALRALVARLLEIYRTRCDDMVHVSGAARDYDGPFGGYKQSGNGREGGLPGLEEYLPGLGEYLEPKTLHLPEAANV